MMHHWANSDNENGIIMINVEVTKCDSHFLVEISEF